MSRENMMTIEKARKMDGLLQPAARHLIGLSISQKSEARDDETRTVVTMGGALVKQCLMLLISGIDASVISDALHKTAAKAVEILTVPTEFTDRDYLVKCVLNGAGAPVIELSRELSAWAKEVLHGMESKCVKSFAEALEDIPYTLAPENAELNSIDTVTELRNKHHTTNILEENVVLVSASEITLVIECVTIILKARDSS